MAGQRTQDRPRRWHRRLRWVILAGLVVGGILVGTKVVLFLKAKPSMTVDYAARYNELTRPAGYDPNDNAAPYYEKAFALLTDMHHRFRVGTEALITALGALRYRQDKGRWPESLRQLVDEGYVPTVPMDPYSGEPLVYEAMGDTFALYSLGMDFDNDGGTPSSWGRPPNGGDQVFWPIRED